MQKNRKLSILLIQVLLGAIIIFLMTNNATLIDFFETEIGLKRPNINLSFTDISKVVTYMLVPIISVTIITLTIRFFTSTKNIKIMSKMLSIFVFLLLSLPITTLLFCLTEDFLTNAIMDALCKAIDVEHVQALGLYLIEWLIFSLFFLAISEVVEKYYVGYLKKDHKRCSLVICEVVSKDQISEKEIIVKKKIFSDCYNFMKNNEYELSYLQFFKIKEMNFSGKKEVDCWRYYSNKEIIREEDEELCENLIRKKENEHINWLG